MKNNIKFEPVYNRKFRRNVERRRKSKSYNLFPISARGGKWVSPKTETSSI